MSADALEQLKRVLALQADVTAILGSIVALMEDQPEPKPEPLLTEEEAEDARRDSTDRDTAIRTIAGEARGEDPEVQAAVADVILERYHTNYRGMESLHQVCMDPWQFSCWNQDVHDGQQAYLSSLDSADPVYQTAERCLDNAIEVRLRGHSITNRSRHFHDSSIGFPSAWGAPQEPALVLGSMTFYNTVK